MQALEKEEEEKKKLKIMKPTSRRSMETSYTETMQDKGRTYATQKPARITSVVYCLYKSELMLMLQLFACWLSLHDGRLVSTFNGETDLCMFP